MASTEEGQAPPYKRQRAKNASQALRMEDGDEAAPSLPEAVRNGGDTATAQGLEEPLVARPTRPFLVERFFAKHEFTAEFMLGSSDAESWSVRELLDIACSRGDMAAAKEWEGLALGYTESPGHPELRKAIAGQYGWPIGPDQVLCVVPEEGIFLSMSFLLSPGDVVIAMMPAYQSLYGIARARGCVVLPWSAIYAPGVGWSFILGDLRDILARRDGQRVRMLVTNFPHNPTAWMPTSAEHEELISLCEANDLMLFSDEMYWGMAVGREEAPLSSCRRYKRAITLSGLSKPHGLPGLRVGWLATQDEDAMSNLRQAKDYTTICGSAPSEVLAIIALRHSDALLARAWETTQRNRELFRSFCADYAHLFEWAPRPAHGLVAFVVLRGWAANMGAQAFADWCVKASSCVVVPSDCFESPDPPAVRIGLGRRNFHDALVRLRACLSAAAAGESAP